MDFVIGMVSIMKDMSSIDKEYRNLNLQLKYTIDKAKLTLKNTDKNLSHIQFMIRNLQIKMKDAQKYADKLDQLLNTKQIAMQFFTQLRKDKIRLSLPFNQIKTQITSCMEILEKTITDIKQYIPQQSKNEMKQGVKRKISESSSNQQKKIKTSRNQLSVQEINQQIQVHYQMGPTINDDQIIFSQTKKSNCAQFTITIRGQEPIMKLLETEQKDLISKIVTLNQKQSQKQIILYTVARLNFQKIYGKLKAITKDIDRISTKSHFHIIVLHSSQSVQFQNLEKQQNFSTCKKSFKIRNSSSSQKPEQDEFFSFPNQQRILTNFQFKVIARKQDKSKTLYKMSAQEWVKVEQEQISIMNGQKLAAFINPQTKIPSFYFQVTWQTNTA